MPRYSASVLLLAAFVASCLGTTPAFAQYFGRNKVQYDDFDFKKFETEHFEFYYYPEEEEAVRDVARMAERWYRRHSRTFLREFTERKPIILYANDADFQQTNVIGGFIGQGTGGVTESLRERVVMPLTGIYEETDHVLGHELVHSFQYDIGLAREDSMRFALGMLPLWLIEGTAEYLSVGRRDPHTAMWLRDAVLRDDLPTIDQLTRDMRYFPYRFGQAYMAYIGGKYGDAAVANIFKLGGRVGLDSSFVYALGIQADSLSNEWIAAVKEVYTPLMEGRTDPEDVGRLVLAEDLDGGSINLAPAISPDGKYVAFLSERDVFNINVFIADAETGNVVKKLKATNANPHFDAIRFINSAGTWSPDGKQFAFITFVEGDNEIAIWDLDSGDITRRIAVEGVSALSNPAWSPDGTALAFSGMDGGISDLYVLDLASGAVRQITDDRYADLQPTWSPDGQTLAFVTDRGPEGTNFDVLDYGHMALGLIDASGTDLRVLRPFEEAKHINPQFSPDGRSLYFISDQDGFQDIYRYDLAAEGIYRVTRVKTGISGITDLSPAMSVASQSGRMMFSVFSHNEYNVFAREASETVGEPVVPDQGVALASVLPPYSALNEGLVASYLADPVTGLPEGNIAADVSDYSPRLRLDYVAPPTVGVAAGGPFGTRVGGGVGFYFSDMLGNQNLAIVAQANGTFKDLGGQVMYLNRGDRLNYGASAGHIPVLYGGVSYGVSVDPETGQQTPIVQQIFQRIYIDEVSVGAAYPFTTTRRVEFDAGFRRYGFDYEAETYYLTPFGARREKTNLDELEPDPIYFGLASAAYVGDYSNFGFTSPVQGGRYRLQLSPLVGSGTFVTALADYRRYFFLNPLTFAVRGLHIGNYGADTDDSDDNLFARQYLGYANQIGFIRGYNFNSFDVSECPVDRTDCPAFDRLLGTHIALTSAELRLPLLGTEALGLINFPYLPTELSLFADAGLAWNDGDNPFDMLTFEERSNDRLPVTSVGISSRFNLLGYLILEVYYVQPFQRPDKGAHFGFQLVPGW